MLRHDHFIAERLLVDMLIRRINGDCNMFGVSDQGEGRGQHISHIAHQLFA